jgi:hypothetical protein
MSENLFIGNNVIQSNWDTNDYFKARHQLRARIDNDTLYVQVVEQNLIERIETWLSHHFGQNNTYAHQLKLSDMKMTSQRDATDLTISLQKILNNCCKLNQVKKFNTQTVLADLTVQFEGEMEHNLMEVTLLNWQSLVDWIIKELNKAKEFNKEEENKIEDIQKSLITSWQNVNENYRNPESKQLINQLMHDPNNVELQNQVNAISEPFTKKMEEDMNYMRNLYIKARQPVPTYQPTITINPNREVVEEGLRAFHEVIQEALADKSMDPTLVKKKEAYLEDLSQLKKDIKTMNGRQALKAMEDFNSKHLEILQLVLRAPPYKQ